MNLINDNAQMTALVSLFVAQLPVLIVCLLARRQAGCAAAERTQVPALFHHSYFGVSACYADFGFSNAQLAPPLHATSIRRHNGQVR